MGNNQKLYINTDSTPLKSDFCSKDTPMVERKSSGNETIDTFLPSRVKSVRRRQQKNSIKKAARNHTIEVFSLLIFSFLLINCFLTEITEGSPKHYCLRHCHMCKEMYGRHFMIHLCKDDCIESRGRYIPDCLNLNSIREYLILTD